MNSTIQLGDLRLADPADLVSGWVPGPIVREIQPVQLARAKNAKQFERGNVLLSYSFTVSKGHQSLSAAEDYLVQIPRLVARAFGNFTAQRGLGAPTVELVEASANIQPQPVNGLRTTITYTVTGALKPDVN